MPQGCRALTAAEARALAVGSKVVLLEAYERGAAVARGTVGAKAGFNEDTGNVVVNFGRRSGACPRPGQLAVYR
ncbi:MAG: hypothetical protein AAFU33_28735, partial [Bacteroidota bacterium]